MLTLPVSGCTTSVQMLLPCFTASWLRSRTAGLVRTPGHDRGDIFLISGAYPLARGISLIGAAFTARYDAGQSTHGREDRNRGHGVVTGIRLAF